MFSIFVVAASASAPLPRRAYGFTAKAWFHFGDAGGSGADFFFSLGGAIHAAAAGLSRRKRVRLGSRQNSAKTSGGLIVQANTIDASQSHTSLCRSLPHRSALATTELGVLHRTTNEKGHKCKEVNNNQSTRFSNNGHKRNHKELTPFLATWPSRVHKP